MAYGRLDVYWPEGKIESFVLEEDTVAVGRAAGNTIALDTENISRYHFSITYEKGQVHITDLDSANGTYVDGVRLEANQPRLLGGVEEIMIGHLRLLFNPMDESPTLPISALDDTQRIEKKTIPFRIEVDANTVNVWPASNSNVELYVTNTGEESAYYTVKAEGLPAEWTRINRPELFIEGGQRAQVLVNFKPPRRSDTQPGDTPVRITVALKDKPELVLVAEVNVVVNGFMGMGMALAQDRIETGNEFDLFLLNQGSVPLPVSVSVVEATQTLDFTLPDSPITLQPAQRVQVQGQFKPTHPFYFGQPYEKPFDIQVRSHTPAQFLAVTRATAVVQPLLPTWALITGGGVLLALVAIVIVLIGGALSVPPEPNIAQLSVNSTQVAQGEPLVLNWEATDAASFNVYVNQTPVSAELDGNTRRLQLDTSRYNGNIAVALEGVNGENSDTATTDIQVYTPVELTSFTVEPTQLVLNVVDTLTISWDAPGAVTVQLNGLDGFTNAPLEDSYSATGTIEVSGIPQQAMTVLLYAEDEVGNGVEQSVALSVITPECLPDEESVVLREGPDLAYQVVTTVQAGAPLTVIAQDTSGDWLQFEMNLPEGIGAWGPRDAFVCAETFDPVSLRINPDVPPLPTATPTATATPTNTPTPTATFTPSITPTPTNLPVGQS